MARKTDLTALRTSGPAAALPVCREALRLMRELLVGTDGEVLMPCLHAFAAEAARRPEQAQALQGEMFVAASQSGGLDIRLAFYRGFDEFKVSRWTSDGRELARLMSAVRCLAGRTQIARLLRYAVEQRRDSRIDAVVFVGDCCEEDVDAVGHEAGQLGLLGLPVFVFHEGEDRVASRLFPRSPSRRAAPIASSTARARTSSSGCSAPSPPMPRADARRC
jgi:hypothetical protein